MEAEAIYDLITTEGLSLSEVAVSLDTLEEGYQDTWSTTIIQDREPFRYSIEGVRLHRRKGLSSP